MKILKFGGSSISSAEKISSVVDIICQKLKENEYIHGVVFSAMGGITDRLIETAEAARLGDENYHNNLHKLEEHHAAIIKQLLSPAAQSKAMVPVKLQLNELEELLHGIQVLKEFSAKTLDQIMSYGEILSSILLSEVLQEKGINCERLDTRKIIYTDSSFGAGKVNYEKTNAAIQKYFASTDKLQIITGFIARNPQGETVTLGRGGSDYTASIFGTALKVDQIEIWTDVDGILSSDPRKVKKAFSQGHVSYSEALELSHFGAKVIYPPAIQPATEAGIAIQIKNTFNPEAVGTRISKDPSSGRHPVTGVSSITEISFLRLQGSGMLGVTGISARLFSATAREQISVILITQASSEHTICFAVKPEHSKRAARAINEQFSLEIQTGLIEEVIIENDLSIVSVVGEDMIRRPGIAGKVFHALGKNGVNIVAIAQGSSERNISAVIYKKDEVKALNALHEELFFPESKSVNIFITGTGLIGKELIKQIEEHQSELEKELDHTVKIIGLTNSRKMLIMEEGIPVAECLKTLEEDGEEANLQDFLSRMKAAPLPEKLFVDCTASEKVSEHYGEILDSSIALVTPNKKAQSGDLNAFNNLKLTAARRNTSFLFETSVGAGLPVISTLKDLRKSGDRIKRIEAVLSGTLSYIFNTFDGKEPFSKVVKGAQEAGFTEPDPRDDLNGLDVARKILILARECGENLTLGDISVESLVSENCKKAADTAEYFKRLQEEDGQFAEKQNQATSEGKKLCYIASFENQKAAVRLKTIGPEHPFYNLSGSDNIISFTTDRYSACPLVVKGPGAGAAVTAAGVFADILRLAD